MTEVVIDAPEPGTSTLAQKLLAEAIGTAILVFVGCGTAVATGGDVAPTGLAFGITILMLAYSFGRVSGGHFNPAVSLGAALAGRIAWKETGLYAAVQVVGGLLGGLLLALVALSIHAGGEHWKFGDPLGNNGYGDNYGSQLHIGLGGALLLEVILTGIFVLVILAVTDRRNPTIAALAPLAIGLALAALHFVAINLDGTSVNPARSLGVAFFSGSDAIKDVWLFVVAPLIGAALVGALYPILFGRDGDPVPGSGIKLGGGGAADQAFAQQWGQQAAAQQPIIQDGWQWDPASQQWIPAPQQAPAPPAPQASQAPLGGEVQGGWQPPQDGGEHTQVRPPQ